MTTRSGRYCIHMHIYESYFYITLSLFYHTILPFISKGWAIWFIRPIIDLNYYVLAILDSTVPVWFLLRDTRWRSHKNIFQSELSVEKYITI